MKKVVYSGAYNLFSIALLAACNSQPLNSPGDSSTGGGTGNWQNSSIEPSAGDKSGMVYGDLSASGLKKGMVYLGGQWRQSAYEDRGDFAVVNKHIRIPKGQFIESNAEDSGELGLLAQADGGRISTSHLYPSGEVPYELEGNFKNTWHGSWLEAAIADINALTPIRIVPKDPKKHNGQMILKIRFDDKALQCVEAPWGRQGSQEENVIRILQAPGCLSHPRVKGEYLQALLKAIGMGPEYLRPDRDLYVDIKRDNLIDANDPSLNTLSGIAMGSFDFDSVTMIGPHLFGKAKDKSKPVITRKNGKHDFVGMNELSEGDLRAVALLYENQGSPLIAPDRTDGLPDVAWSDASAISNIKFTINEAVKRCANVKVQVQQGYQSQISQLYGFNPVIKQDGNNTKACLIEFAKTEPEVYFCFDKGLVPATHKCKPTRYGLSPGHYKVTLSVQSNANNKIVSTEIFTIRWKDPKVDELKVSADFDPLGHRATLYEYQKGITEKNLIRFADGTNALSVLAYLRSEHKDKYNVKTRMMYTVEGPDAQSFVVVADKLLSTEPLTKSEYKFSIKGEDTISGVSAASGEYHLIAGSSFCSQSQANEIMATLNNRTSSIEKKILDTKATCESQEKSIRDNHAVSKEILSLQNEISAIELKLKSPDVQNKVYPAHPCEMDATVLRFPDLKDNGVPADQCKLVREWIKDSGKLQTFKTDRLNSLLKVKRKQSYNNLAASDKQIYDLQMSNVSLALTTFKLSMPQWDVEDVASRKIIDDANAGLATTRTDLEAQLQMKKSALVAANNRLGEVQSSVDTDPNMIAARAAAVAAMADNVQLRFGDVKEGRQREQQFLVNLLNEKRCLMLGYVPHNYFGDMPGASQERGAYWANLYASITSFQ